MATPPSCSPKSLTKLTRRAVCAGALALPALARAAPDLGQLLVQAVRGQMAALGDGPVLLNSYLVKSGPGADNFDLTQANAAYVYDLSLIHI